MGVPFPFSFAIANKRAILSLSEILQPRFSYQSVMTPLLKKVERCVNLTA